VSIDPAITANKESDMTGIVVAGVDVNSKGYILGDHTDRLSPQGWASKAIELYHHYQADRIVAERNQGGDMVRRTIEVEDETVPIKLVHASRPLGSIGSPDRLDALVWALTELLLNGAAKPQLKLVYSDSKGLR